MRSDDRVTNASTGAHADASPSIKRDDSNAPAAQQARIRLPTRIDMTRELAGLQAPDISGTRAPSLHDTLPLAHLLFYAYQGTIDAEEETVEDAVAEMARTQAGEYGPYLPNESRLVVRNNEVVSAVLLTFWKDRPLVAFAMTSPRYKRQGFARACMLHCMQALAQAGHSEVSLVVTVKNEAAMQLYRQLGFREGR